MIVDTAALNLVATMPVSLQGLAQFLCGSGAKCLRERLAQEFDLSENIASLLKQL